MITIRQVRAATALLGWSGADLAAAAGLSEAGMAALDAAEGPLSPRSEDVAAVRGALEGAGIVFIGGEGVRLEASSASGEGRRPDELDSSNDD